MVYNVAMSRIHSGSRTGALQSRAHPREVLDLVSSPHDPFHRPLFRSDSEGEDREDDKAIAKRFSSQTLAAKFDRPKLETPSHVTSATR